MSGFGYSDWSYDPFEKMVIFLPDPLLSTLVVPSTGIRASPPDQWGTTMGGSGGGGRNPGMIVMREEECGNGCLLALSSTYFTL